MAELSVIQSDPSTMMNLISRMASDPTCDVDKLERLMAMKERMDAKTAEQAFNDAMNLAQSEIKAIGWDKQNGQTHSAYVTYAKMDAFVRPVYVHHGFSLSFDTGETDKPQEVRFLCYVSHKEGHTRTYKVDMPADGKGAKGNDVMTRTHAFGSATSYGRRYLLKMIFNVIEAAEDDDGNSASDKVIDQEESNEAKEARFLAEHQAAVGRNWRTISLIKEHLLSDEPDGYAIAEAWYELNQEEQRALWRAPSKGGCFSTPEREWMKKEMPKFKDSHGNEE